MEKSFAGSIPVAGLFFFFFLTSSHVSSTIRGEMNDMTVYCEPQCEEFYWEEDDEHSFSRPADQQETETDYI